MMVKFFSMLIFLTIGFSLSAQENNAKVILEFSPFKDTIVTGFDTEVIIKSEYEIKSLSISATGCTFMLKDAEKGIYVVNAPVTSSGKTSIITVSHREKNGSFTKLEKLEIKIVPMSTEMRKRYVNYITHKK
jgi:hypothetical protein